MNPQEIIQDYKNGMTINEIARKNHVANSTISGYIKPLNLPTNKVINNINNWEGFKEFFIDTYNSSDSMQEIYDILLKHPYFKRTTRKSISQRVIEIRNLFGLPPKMPEITYDTEYDRIRGYIIRNSKYCAKRRNIEFSIKYTDFELPELCPILGIKLEYGAGHDGNAPQHATLDRIDNTKGYVPGNVMIVSRLANAMKNEASFNQLQTFITNYSYLINYINEHGTLGNITDIFPHWKKLSLDS